MRINFPEQKLVIASHNAGKLREFEKLLALPGIALVGAGDLGLPEPEETGNSFFANARLKAVAACHAANLPSLADDSGVCVDALDGAPGIYSARWAGPNKDFSLAFEKIKSLLAEKKLVTSRGAFVAVLCLAFPDGRLLQAEGRVEGTLTFPPRGEGGFGYDPLFIPDGHTCTFGEKPELKNTLSHRARAVEKLKAELAKAGA